MLHVLNLVTTLTTETAYDRHTTHSPSASPSPIDITSSLLAPALVELTTSSPTSSFIVHLAPAIHFRAIDPTTIPYNIPSNQSAQSEESHSLATFDRFMSRWTRLVGDPVMSKWIVVALAISVLLNGYLLKGLGSDSGFATGSAAEAAARILLASTSGIEVDEQAQLRKKWSGELKGLSELQKDWTVEDAQAMASQHRRRSELAVIEAEKTAPELIKVLPTPHTRTSSEEDEISPPPSPIFVRTKLRKVSLVPASVAPPAISTTTSTAPPSIALNEREIRLSPSTVALVPLGTVPETPRTLEVCAKIFDGGVGAILLNDEEIIMLVQKGKVAAYALEKLLNDYERSVAIRRALICMFFLLLSSSY